MKVNKLLGRGVERELILLGIMSAFIILAGGISLLYTAQAQTNHVQLVEEQEIVNRLVSQQLSSLTTDIVTEFTWDEAYDKLKDRSWSDWADRNIGAAFQKSSHHDMTLVVDGQNETTFGWRRGVAMSGAERGSLTWRCARLIEAIRAEERRRTLQPKARARAGVPEEITSSALIANDGEIYFVSAALVLPATTGVALRPEPAPVVVSARRMEGWFLRDVLSGMRVHDATLTLNTASPGPPTGPDSAEVPLTDRSGATIGSIRWRPRLPGAQLMAMTAPWLAGAFLLLMGSSVAMVMRIHRVLGNLADAENGLEQTILELMVAIDQADAASVAKSQFLANMSHEIRTPLNAILGLAQTLAYEDMTPSQRVQVQTIHRAGQGLLAVVNDVLEYSKLEAGKVQIVNAPFSIAGLVDTVTALFEENARENGLTLTVSVPPECSGLWLGDETRIRQIILNLVSNAIKFSDSGVVRLEARPACDGVVFSVIDQGIGIPPEKLDHLFKKFSQVDASSTRQRGGTGLGLAICSELVELMGGEITVESRVGLGSEFFFKLPLTRCGQGVELAAESLSKVISGDSSEAPQPRIRVLAAEDNHENQFVLKSIMSGLNIDLAMAGNGREAVSQFRVEDFDLVLMDIQMPEMNGFEATLQIRNLETRTSRPRTPIVAISASASEEQVRSYLAIGMDGFVAKPISIPNLLKAMEDALRNPGAQAPGGVPQTADEIA